MAEFPIVDPSKCDRCAELESLLNDARKVLELPPSMLWHASGKAHVLAQRIADKIGSNQGPVRVTVQLHPDVVDALKSQAEVEGITPTELLRRLIGGDK